MNHILINANCNPGEQAQWGASILISKYLSILSIEMYARKKKITLRVRISYDLNTSMSVHFKGV